MPGRKPRLEIDMKLKMLRGARGENGQALSVGEIVEVSEELGTVLIQAHRATANIPAEKPKKRRKKVILTDGG